MRGLEYKWVALSNTTLGVLLAIWSRSPSYRLFEPTGLRQSKLACLAVLAVGAARRSAAAEWLGVMVPAWRDTSAASCLISLLLVLASPYFPAPALHAWTLAATAMTLLGAGVLYLAISLIG